MAEISAALVKELREKTGAGMMECKKALTENAGDLEQAVDWLRKKGLASAAKKSGRVASEGLVGVSVQGTRGAAVEVNSETDFVARNEKFQGLVSAVAGLALGSGGDVEQLKAATYPGAGHSVAEELTKLIATIGENMVLRRTSALSVSDGVVAAYVHNQTAPGLGKIGVLVALESSGDKAKLTAFGRSRCISPPPIRRRWSPRTWTPPSSTASAPCCPSRPPPAARRRRSSPRWSRAACASTTKRSACWSRSTSSTARAG